MPTAPTAKRRCHSSPVCITCLKQQEGSWKHKASMNDGRRRVQLLVFEMLRGLPDLDLRLNPKTSRSRTPTHKHAGGNDVSESSDNVLALLKQFEVLKPAIRP